jgi:transposase
VQNFLVRAKIRLPEAEAPESSSDQQETSLPSFSTTPKRFQQTQARLLRKWEIAQQVQELHRQGVSLIKIAAQLGLARNTVRTYVRQPPDPPAPKPRPLRASQLDPYEAYLLKRWREGCRNAALLHREISEMGYPGAQTMVRAYLAYLRKHPEQANHDHPRKERAAAASPRALRWLLTRSPEDLTQEDQAKRTRLLEVSEEVRRVHTLLQAFQEMVRQRQPERLRAWMQEANQSGIAELKSFVAGIERDYDAVKAALRLPWSQGTTEGKVNKLKTLKRVMYGRAGFPLLRQRLLHDA